MAQQALVAIVPGAQAIEVGMELGKDRIEFAEPGDRRTWRHIRARIAGRLQLAGSIDTLVERGQFIGGYGCPGGRVGTDDRRLWNWDTPILKIAGGVLLAAADARVRLRQTRRPRHA